MIKNIIFDFDGVILDSMAIKADGFRQIFKEYSYDQVESIIKYHYQNGGRSRFDKIIYFYQNILKKNIDEDKIDEYAQNFSLIITEQLCNQNFLIKDTISFIRQNYKNYNFHIASGAEEQELIYLCKKHDISKYFRTIYGYPPHKTSIVNKILTENSYDNEETILIGDSVNDKEAAMLNNIGFYGYNNPELISYKDNYIHSFNSFTDQ